MKKVRRLHITLVEILIVITILSLVAGVIGININRALMTQRFRTEVDLMVDTLRLSQDLMLILDTDVHLKVKAREDKKAIEYWLEVEGGVPKVWEPVIGRSRRTLDVTHMVNFVEQQPFPIPEGDQLDIRFQSGGSMMSKGVFRMSTHEEPYVLGSLTRAICLRGYPHPIVSVPETEKSEECEEEEDTDFHNRLTFYTTQEILEDVAPEKTLPPS